MRTPLIIALLSSVAICINPFGYKLFLFPFHVASDLFVQEINEWKAPDLQGMWYARVWIIFLLLAAAWRGGSIAWRWRLLCAFLLWEALGHIRHLSLAVLLLTPFVAVTLRAMLNWLPHKTKVAVTRAELALSPLTGPLLIVALLIITVAVTALTKADEESQSCLVKRFKLPDTYSAPAVEFLKGNGNPGKYLFNEYSWGDFLLYALKQPPQIFIDGRADMYGEEIFADYLAISRLTPQVDTLMEKYRIDWVLFPLDHPLIRYLQKIPGWETLYLDDQVAIMAKGEGGRL